MPAIGKATPAPAAPQQFTQKSRKGKKAWRKNVDVTEVTEGLKEVRDELISGGVIAEKDSADLFTFDIAGDKGIAKKYLRGSKPLKADEIINQRSAVAAVLMRKRQGENTTDGIVDAKRKRVSYVSHQELERLRLIANGQGTKSVVEVTEASYDPWDAAVDIQKATVDPRFNFIKKSEKAKAPKTIKHKPISLAASGKTVPAVMRPEGGFSYNPIYTDYEDRLNKEGAKEVAAEMKRLEATEAERVKEEARLKSGAEADAAERRGDLSEWEEDSEWEGLQSGTEDVRLNAKRPERKTPQQRNKIKRRKEEAQKQKTLADIKKREEQAREVKKISKAIKERDAERALALAEREVDSSDSDDGLELRRRQLGKIRLPEKELELVLPDELQESLRLLKPEGNLLKDRYRSLLVRGKMESRRKINFHKQAKVKATEKWTHKDFMLH